MGRPLTLLLVFLLPGLSCMHNAAFIATAFAGRLAVAKFKLGDLVKMAGHQPSGRYTGRVLGLIEEPTGAIYTIEVKDTGWICSFAEADLEPMDRSQAAKA